MPANPVAKWEEFLRTRYWDELLELADSYQDERSQETLFQTSASGYAIASANCWPWWLRREIAIH
jgi:hypothetical protein